MIRHGETIWTRERRYQGHTDTKLTVRGRQQAGKLARSLKHQDVRVLYTSALGRARETGAILAKPLKLKPRIDSRLNELYFGRWEGRTGVELAREKDPAFLRWACGKIVTPPEGESVAALQKRTRAFLGDLLRRHAGKSVAVVSHAGTIKTLICHAFKIPFRSFWAFRIDPASISIFDFHPSLVQCISLNSSAEGPSK